MKRVQVVHRLPTSVGIHFGCSFIFPLHLINSASHWVGWVYKLCRRLRGGARTKVTRQDYHAGRQGVVLYNVRV